MKQKLTLALLGGLFSSTLYAHGLTPQRFYTPAPGHVQVLLKATTFLASNYETEVFFAGRPEVSTDLVKGLDNPISFNTNRPKIMLRANGSTNLRVSFEAKEVGIYLVCTVKQSDEASPLNTRVCARVGVGMEPNLER